MTGDHISLTAPEPAPEVIDHPKPEPKPAPATPKPAAGKYQPYRLGK